MWALAAAAGMSFMTQQAVNSSLVSNIDSAARAGFASYLGGTLCMLLFAVARDGLPSARSMAQADWWAWTGGFFGAVYIAVSILLLPRLGAGTFDHVGWFGLPRHSADLPRLIGAGLLIAGVALIRL
jgi:bacterial/archaeal transporter family-2 protein